MKEFLLGWAIISTLINVYVIWILSKKNTTENNIDNLKQKNKRNKQSNIENDITAQIQPERGKKYNNKHTRRIILTNKKEKK